MVATLNSGQYLSCPNLEWNGLNDDELAFHSKLYSVYFLLGDHYFTAKEKYHHIDQNRNFDKHILKGEHCWQVDNSFFGKICPWKSCPFAQTQVSARQRLLSTLSSGSYSMLSGPKFQFDNK